MIDVKYRLERWADFMRVAPDFGLGYPKQTVENRETFGGSSQTIELPDDVQRTEEAVRRLDADKLEVIRLIYVRRRRIKEAAFLIRRPRAWVRQSLDLAEHQVMGYLVAIE